MTIRIENLTIDHDDAAWVLGGGHSGLRDVTNDETFRFDLLSVVRHILRERGDCRMVPVVVAAIVHPTNEWGHNMQVEVQYTNRWRAIYGAHRAERVTNVQCYMD